MKNMNAKRVIAAAITATLLIGAGAFAYNTHKVSAASENENSEETMHIDGGWEASENYKLDDEAKAAFEKATKDLLGVDYEAIALLGKQVVAGTNYSILVRKTVVVPDAEPTYSVITIYEDLDGNISLGDMETLELGVSDEETSDYTEGVGTPDGQEIVGSSLAD